MLVTAIRDAADSLIENKGKPVIDIIERSQFKPFKRIGLYLRRRWPDVDPQGTANLVANPAVVTDTSLSRELAQLLQERFNTFPPDIQEKYLAIVEQGIDLNLDDDDQAYLNRWQYQKLWPIRNFLNEQWQQRFNELSSRYGTEDPNRVKESVWMGPTSPKKVDELRAMELEELIHYLTTWQPPEERWSHSREGLGRELTALVESEPEIFSDNAIRFQSLDPDYVCALFDGLRSAVKNGKGISWQPVLSLCNWVVKQPREIPGRKSEYSDLDPGWVWTRKAIADLMEEGFNSETAPIPYDMKELAWEIICPLTDDPDPTPEDEERTNMDPSTASINSTRGRAMHAVISYALWLRRLFEKMENSELLIQRGFKEMPEIQIVLERHLDRNIEDSFGVHSVYGMYLPWIVLLDRQWAIQNISRIFPRDEALLKYRAAAWGTYITFRQPYDTVVELIRDEYLYEADRLNSIPWKEFGFDNYQEHLAGHFITIFWREQINMAEILHFFEKAPDETCAKRFALLEKILLKF